MKPTMITVAVSIVALFLAAGCTMQVMSEGSAKAAVPTAASPVAVSAPAVDATPAATHAATPTPSAYGELLDGEIRGIAPETVAGYLAGEGLGLALPAELNGYPGPRHVLDLQSELALTPEQVAQVQILFDDMQPQAIALGQAILAAEAQLEAGFRNQTIDEETLDAQLRQIGTLQAKLRFVHLSTHLATVEILSPHQSQLYNALRGYAEMPAGQEHQDHQGHQGHQ